MDIKDCLEKGLLKKDLPSREKAKKSLEVAKIKLEKARRLFELDILDMANINLYSTMFHASRALMFKDGFKERSHYAIYIYLKEKYSDKIPLKYLNEINNLRLERHEIFYGFDEPELKKENIRTLISLSKDFIDIVKGLI